MSDQDKTPAYPSAAPTREECAAFDALPAAERERLLHAAINEGFASGTGTRDMDDILDEARQRAKADHPVNG